MMKIQASTQGTASRLNRNSVSPRRLMRWGIAVFAGVLMFATAEASWGQQRDLKKPGKTSEIEGRTNDWGSREFQRREGAALESMQEIDRLRREMGSGISERLEGVPGLTKKDADSRFQNALKSLANERAGQQAGHPVEQTVEPAVELPQMRRKIDGPRIQRPVVRGNTPAKVEMRRDPQAIALRSVARQLEAMAAEMEEVGLFDRADHLRHQAMDFWHQAR